MLWWHRSLIPYSASEVDWVVNIRWHYKPVIRAWVGWTASSVSKVLMKGRLTVPLLFHLLHNWGTFRAWLRTLWEGLDLWVRNPTTLERNFSVGLWASRNVFQRIQVFQRIPFSGSCAPTGQKGQWVFWSVFQAIQSGSPGFMGQVVYRSSLPKSRLSLTKSA